MNCESATTGKKEGALIPWRVDAWWGKGIYWRLVFVAYLALMAGCSSTVVNDVWEDGIRAHAALGKTLVLAEYPKDEIAIMLENEWTRQLRAQGIEAEAIHTLHPAQGPLDRQSVIAIVKAKGFHTVLVSRFVSLKSFERNIPVSQVEVHETVLYDTETHQPFWKVETDTFIVASNEQLIHDFVQIIIQTMIDWKVL